MILIKDEVILNLTENHKTVKNIRVQKAFAVSIANREMLWLLIILGWYFEIIILIKTKNQILQSLNQKTLMHQLLMNFQFVWNVN